ncbi:MAG: hypothetical protein Q8Q13_00955 [bacterium]|nr:hypothetical protein [bacterium]
MSENIKTGHERRTALPINEQSIPLKFDELLSAAFVGTASGQQGEYADLKGIMGSILREVTQNPEREEKYKDFLKNVFKLKNLWQLAGLPNVEHRFRACVLIYFQQRLFDDIMDGDTPEKLVPAERVAYARVRLEHLRTGNFDGSDPIDAFTIRILGDISSLDTSYVPKARQRLEQIMNSITFDGERICATETPGTWKFSSSDELQRHFFNLDTEGVIGLTLFLFGFQDSENNMKLLTPLAQATRIAYNVRDFAADVRAGLCNIPAEDAEVFRITDADLRKVVAARHTAEFPQNITDWLLGQVVEGQKLLGLHASQPTAKMEPIIKPRRVMQSMRLSPYRKFVASKVLKTAYVDVAQKVFRDATRELR